MNPCLRMAGPVLSGRVMQWFSSRPPAFSLANRNENYRGCLLDFGRGFGPAVFHRGLERGVVEFVLVGVDFGEVGDGLVELG